MHHPLIHSSSRIVVGLQRFKIVTTNLQVVFAHGMGQILLCNGVVSLPGRHVREIWNKHVYLAEVQTGKLVRLK